MGILMVTVNDRKKKAQRRGTVSDIKRRSDVRHHVTAGNQPQRPGGPRDGDWPAKSFRVVWPWLLSFWPVHPSIPSENLLLSLLFPCAPWARQAHPSFSFSLCFNKQRSRHSLSSLPLLFVFGQGSKRIKLLFSLSFLALHDGQRCFSFVFFLLVLLLEFPCSCFLDILTPSEGS